MREQCVPGLPSPRGRPGNEAMYIHISGRLSEEVDLEPQSWELVVKCEGESIPVWCEWREDGLEVCQDGGGETLTISTDWRLGEPMMIADIEGKEVAVQVRYTHVQYLSFSDA